MSTKTELNQIRAMLARRPKGPGRRLSPELRTKLARYARVRLREGAAHAAVARELGVGVPTLGRALEATSEPLLPIAVAPTKDKRQDLTVRGPGGLTVEGLDIEGVAALLRALS